MIVLFSLILACGGGAQEAVANAPATNVEKAASNAGAPAPGDAAKIAEALKLADAADGTEDKIAIKCAGCALAMDGSPDHAIVVEGTTLHLCSAMCKTEFTKDTPGNLAKLVD